MVVRPIFLPPPPPPKITPKNDIDRIAELRAQAQKLREQIRLAQKMGEAEEATKLQKELKQTNTELTKLEPPATAPSPVVTPLALANSTPLLPSSGTPTVTPALFVTPQSGTPAVTLVDNPAPVDTPKPGADAGAIVKDVQAGKSVDQIATERGLTRDQVLNELKAGGLDIKTTDPKSDNGDVRTTEISDPKTGQTVTEYYDFQHGTYYTQVKDAKGKETDTPVRDESGQKITTNYDPKTGTTTTRREDDLGTGTITQTTQLSNGVTTVKTTGADGKSTTVVTDAKGQKTTLAASQDPTRKGAEGIGKDVAAGKSIDQIAAERGLTKEQVTAQLAAAGLEVKTSQPTSDNGDVQSTEIVDQKTGKTVTGYYQDYQHDSRTVRTTDEKGNAVTTSTEANGTETKSVVEGNGRTTRTVKQGKDTTVSVTFNGYTLTTKPDGSMTLHDDATGRDVKVKPDSAEAALAQTLVSIDPKSSDPQEAKKAEIIKTTLDGIFAGEELPSLQQAVTDLHQKTQDAIAKYGEGQPGTNPTAENPYGTPPPGKAPSGGDWVPKNGKWVDPVVAKAMDAENVAIGQRAEASAKVNQSQAQLNVYALDPAYKGAMTDAKVLLDDKLAPFGLQWNAPTPEGSLADAKKALTDANSQLTNATTARENYEKAQRLLDQAISKQATLPPPPPLPGQTTVRATAADDHTNYELKDAQSKAAHDDVTALFYQAGLSSSQGDKALADYLVGVRQQEVNATKPGTPERTAAEKNLSDAKTLSENAGKQVDAATTYSNFYSATSTLSGQEVQATDLRQKILAQYRAANPGSFDMEKEYSTYGGDYLGKIKEQHVIEDPKDHQLYLETKYEHDTKRVQLTFTTSDKNIREDLRNGELNKQWQALLNNPANANMCYADGRGGLAAAKAAQVSAGQQIQAMMKDQLGLVRDGLDKQITGLKTDLDGALKQHGPGSVEAPAGLLPQGTQPVEVTVNGQKVQVTPDMAGDVQRGGIDAIVKSGKPVRMEINGQWLWVHPDVAAAQIRLDAAQDQRASVENARQSAERSEQWYSFLLTQPLKLLDDAGSAPYYAHLQSVYLDDHPDQAMSVYQATFQNLYNSGYNDQFTPLEGRQAQEGLVARTLGIDTSSDDGRTTLDKVVDEIRDIGGNTASVKVVPLFYVDDKVGAQQVSLFAVQDGDKTWYVDATGQKFESIKDFQDNNRQFQESGKLIVPVGLSMKPGADGKIDLEVVQARNVSTFDKIIDPIVGIGTALATAVAVIPNPFSPLAAGVAYAGGAYLGTRAVIKEVDYLQHGGELGDMESMMNIGTVATTVLPMGSSVLRTIGMAKTTELSVTQAFRASIGMTGQGSSVATTADAYMRSSGGLNRTARGLDWAAIGTGVPLTAVSAHDLAAYGDQMSGLEFASALTSLGVGVAGTGLGVKGLRATKPLAAADESAGGSPSTALPASVNTRSFGSENGRTLNYLPDGTVTIGGQPVAAKDLSIGLSNKGAVDKDTFLVIADETNLPGATQLIEDLRNAGYRDGQGITILACRAGSLDHQTGSPLTRSLAGEVADRLGVRTRAYDGPVELADAIKPAEGGKEVVELPGLPLTDVSGGATLQQPNHAAQSDFWFGGGRDAAPPASPSSVHGAGDGPIDPITLGKKTGPTPSGQSPKITPPTRKQLQATDPKQLDFTQLNAKNVPWLKPDQVAAFTPKQWEAFKQAGLQGSLTRGQLQAIPENRIRNIDAGSLTKSQVRSLTKAQVAALNGKQLQGLHQAGLQEHLTQGQIGAIPDNRVQYLDSASLTKRQIGGLSQAQIAAMTNSQWKAFNQAGLLPHLSRAQTRSIPENRIADLNIGSMLPKQVSWLTLKQWEAFKRSGLQGQLTQAQIGAIPSNRVKYLDIASLDAKQAGWLKPDQLSALTKSQIRAFSGEQLRALPNASVADMAATLTRKQIPELTLAQMEAVGDTQKKAMSEEGRKLLDELIEVRNLSPDDIARLSPSGIVNLTPDQLRDLTPDQLRAIAPKRIKYLDLAELNPSQLAELTPEQVKKLRPNQLAGLKDDQLQALTPAQVDVLKPFQTALLKGNQRSALNGYTPASAPVRALAKMRAMGVDDLVLTTTATATFAAVWPALPPHVQAYMRAGGLAWRGLTMSAAAALPGKWTALHTPLGRIMKIGDALSYLPTQAAGIPTSVTLGGAGGALFEGSNAFYFAKAVREARTGRPTMPMADKWNLPSYAIGSGLSLGDSIPKDGSNLSSLPGVPDFVSKGFDFVPGAADTVDNAAFLLGSAYLWARGARTGLGRGKWEPSMSGFDRVVFGVTFGGGMILFSGIVIANWLDQQNKANAPGVQPSGNNSTPTPTPTTPAPATPTPTPSKTTPTPTTSPTATSSSTPSPTTTKAGPNKPLPREPGTSEATPAQFVVSADDGLNLRDEPAGDSGVETVIRPGSLVKETGVSKTDESGRTWVPVSAHGADGTEHQGWVEASFVQTHPAGAQDGEGRLNPELERQGYQPIIARDGDTMGGIARNHSADVRETVLLNMGHIAIPDVIFAGDRIYLPGATA
ncbi:SH3 domain-containing protein [Labrys sp. (in: a-proteobacteria)]|uniref:SH3 domain-containing protein n=1 Tax=Labrys sp. (in: a-proteobacteria) TaxID=1917972 RepID=UPI0039E2ECCA